VRHPENSRCGPHREHLVVRLATGHCDDKTFDSPDERSGDDLRRRARSD
jgi:hypothetical protein